MIMHHSLGKFFYNNNTSNLLIGRCRYTVFPRASIITNYAVEKSS